MHHESAAFLVFFRVMPHRAEKHLISYSRRSLSRDLQHHSKINYKKTARYDDDFDDAEAFAVLKTGEEIEDDLEPREGAAA